MKTFEDRVNDLARISDFHTFADALEEYAVDGIACRSPLLQEEATKALKKKLKNHLLADFGTQAYLPGSFNYYIRSGKDAYLPYVYSELMNLSCFGTYDLGHVLSLARHMKKDYEPSDECSITEESITEIMKWMDLKYKYSTRIPSLVPMFLIMPQAPVREGSDFTREGCEVSAYAFEFWKPRKNTLLSAPSETSFLLRLSDEIVKEAWLLANEDYLTVIEDELKLLGYDRIQAMRTVQAHKLIADLVCIGIAANSHFLRYIPFLGQSREYRNAAEKIAEKLLAVVEEKRGF